MAPLPYARRSWQCRVAACVALALLAVLGPARFVDPAAASTSASTAVMSAAAPSPPSRYTAITPTRLADTRTPFGTTPTGRLVPGGTVVVAVTGRAEAQVPARATAVVLGVVSVGATGLSFTTVWPADQPRPLASSLNTGRADVVANMVTTRLSADGKVALFSNVATDLVVDLYGYYTPADGAVTAGRTIAVTPTRAYDSRLGPGPFGLVTTRTIDLPRAVVPASAIAAVVNLTVTESAAGGYWTLFPTGVPLGPGGQPTTSNLNVGGPGRTVAVQAIVPIGADRAVQVFSQMGGHAIVDVFGYVTGQQSPASTDGLFVALAAPARFADTRTADNNPLGPAPVALRSGWSMEVAVLGHLGVAPAASLLVGNTTYVEATAPGYLSVAAAGRPLPATSAVNAWVRGQIVANHTTIPIANRGVAVFANTGGHVIVDVAGYMTGNPLPSVLPPPLYPSARTSCRAVVHLGDSTSTGLISPTSLPNPAEWVDAQYLRVGVLDPRLEISGGRSIVEHLTGQLNGYEVALNQRAAGFRGCWVIALGTNDAANVADGSGVDLVTRIDRMMSVIGRDPVLWVNTKTLVTEGPWANVNMQVWNRTLVAAQARYPNLRIYDWASLAPTSWFWPDGVHYTSTGNRERAVRLAIAVANNYPG